MRHAASGLTARAFCSQEALTESAFYAWRRTIAQRDGHAATGTATPAFVPAVVTQEARGEGAIVLELTGGRVLRLPEAVSATWRAEFIGALDHGGAR